MEEHPSHPTLHHPPPRTVFESNRLSRKWAVRLQVLAHFPTPALSSLPSTSQAQRPLRGSWVPGVGQNPVVPLGL